MPFMSPADFSAECDRRRRAGLSIPATKARDVEAQVKALGGIRDKRLDVWLMPDRQSILTVLGEPPRLEVKPRTFEIRLRRPLEVGKVYETSESRVAEGYPRRYVVLGIGKLRLEDGDLFVVRCREEETR